MLLLNNAAAAIICYWDQNLNDKFVFAVVQIYPLVHTADGYREVFKNILGRRKRVTGELMLMEYA